VAPREEAERLAACGLIIANPPWTLEDELAAIMPALAERLGRDGKAGFRLDWLTRAK
jgi:23S rRNA (adenine2030-N6)-methyltransferase